MVNSLTPLACHMCIDGFQWSENPQAKAFGAGGRKSGLSCMGMLSAYELWMKHSQHLLQFSAVGITGRENFW